MSRAPVVDTGGWELRASGLSNKGMHQTKRWG